MSSTEQQPALLDEVGLQSLAERIAASRPAIFLDYDGTLSEIAPRPDLATLDEGMRDRLRRLARGCPLGIISGRDLDDVRRLVGVEGLIYAGSHGFDIDAPSGRHRMGEEYVAALSRAGEAVERALTAVPGALVEKKRYAVAIHTRQVPPERKPEVGEAVAAVAAGEPELRRTGGKELFELRPNLPWDKGRALLHVLEAEGLGDCTPVYVGDDLTDEDAFAVLTERGIGVRVAEAGEPTKAAFVVSDVATVGRLLDLVADRLQA